MIATSLTRVVLAGVCLAGAPHANGQTTTAATATSASDMTGATDARGIAFEIGEHPTITFGRTAALSLTGKFDIESGTVTTDIEDSRFDLGRRRVGVSGVLFEAIEFQIEREFEEHEPWRDVFVSVRAAKWFGVQLGRFKAPFSREQLTSAVKLDFINRPLAATALSPGRQTGLAGNGSLHKLFSYQVGVFREDRRDLADQSMVAARIIAKPLRRLLRGGDGLEVGAAATTGRLAEGLGDIEGRTISDRNVFFPGVYVKGRRLRTGYEASWTGGGFTLAGEYLQVDEQRQDQSLRGDDLPVLRSRGWYGSAVWLVFGERHGAKLPISFAPLAKRLGGLEIGVRIEELRFSSGVNAEPAYRNPRAPHVLGNASRALTFGVNWYMSRFARLQCNVIGERLADPERSPSGSTDRLWSVLTRLQLHL